jgi:hypothetical protein
MKKFVPPVLPKSDEIKNWTQIFAKEDGTSEISVDKNFAKHMVKPCKMIVIIGSTGSGKSTALVEFLSRKTNVFVEIILFSGSSTDEPLYRALQDRIPGILITDKSEELPQLSSYNESDKSVERLLILDDIINCPPKELKTMMKWFNSARKYGFTVVALVQNFTDLPIQMRRNAHMFFVFRLNDSRAISNLLSTHSDGLSLEGLKDIYYRITSRPNNFLNIDLTEHGVNRFRHNFIGRI